LDLHAQKSMIIIAVWLCF